MKELIGNIWKHHAAGSWIVIGTNGSVRKDGAAVMGRGLAWQAKLRYPDLQHVLGFLISSENNHVFLFPEWRIVTFPVKEKWFEPAKLDLIDQSAHELKTYWRAHAEPIALPKVGCGNGGLNWEDVRPVLERYLDDRFTVVDMK